MEAIVGSLLDCEDQFIAVPRWVYQCVTEGTMSGSEQRVYEALLEQATFSTGIWRGTAQRIVQAINPDNEPGKLGKRAVQLVLKKMHDSGLIKSFQTDGQHGSHYVAIHGYRVRVGEWTGHVLDVAATTENEQGQLVPVYVPTANATAKRKEERNGKAASIEGLSGTSASELSPAAKAPRNDREMARVLKPLFPAACKPSRLSGIKRFEVLKTKRHQ